MVRHQAGSHGCLKVLIKNLVVFDFSGTLSLGSVAFAREDSLVQALKESGLWLLGLRSTKLFWNEIVAPTWNTGATTSLGYVRILYDALRRMFPTAPVTELRTCVANFAGEYFRSSHIEAVWLPLLRELVENPGSFVLIATDHYAEASGCILGQCEAFELPAELLDSEGIREDSRKIYIANSADLGTMKANIGFWRKVKRRLASELLEQLIIIDDFGWNESSGDHYATEEKVAKRRSETEEIVLMLFACPVHVFPFTLCMADGQAGEHFLKEKLR